MSNIKIIADNVVGTASSLTATSEATGHLIAETQNDFKVKTWRSTSLTAQTITITWASGQPIGGLALPFNNLILNSTVQVKLYTLVADGSPALDTGAINVDFAYDPPSGFTTIGSASFAVGGGNYFSTFFNQTTAEKVEIIINSSGNPDSYMELSRIIIGKVVDFNTGVDRNVVFDFNDTTKTIQTDAGDSLADRGVLSRSLKFNFGTMQSADKTTMHSLIRRFGSAVPIFVSILRTSTDLEEAVSGQIYGRFKTLPDTNLFLPGIYKTSVTIDEF